MPTGDVGYTRGVGSGSPASADVPRAVRNLPEALEPLRADLGLVGEQFQVILAGLSPETDEMVRDVATFTGKRMRPALTCLAARIAGSGVTPDVATVAAIVELIHTATLVHDDILDAAEVRRRVPTLNAQWGDQAAVLVGDVLFTCAYRTAAYLEDRFASRYLADVVAEVLQGEILQDTVARNAALTEDQYRRIIRGKTAALYEAALRSGAHYGNAAPAVLDALSRYGHHLGMAFQIADDRLDLTGDEKRTGKSAGRDLSEGKTTLPLILWRDECSGLSPEEARAQIERAWDDEDAARTLVAELGTSGALARADAVAHAEADRAIEALADLPDSDECALLRELARFTVERMQ